MPPGPGTGRWGSWVKPEKTVFGSASGQIHLCCMQNVDEWAHIPPSLLLTTLGTAADDQNNYLKMLAVAGFYYVSRLLLWSLHFQTQWWFTSIGSRDTLKKIITKHAFVVSMKVFLEIIKWWRLLLVNDLIIDGFKFPIHWKVLGTMEVKGLVKASDLLNVHLVPPMCRL